MVVENVLRVDQTLPSYQCCTAVVLISYWQSWTDKDRVLRPRSDGFATIMTDRGGLLWSGTSAKNDRHSVTWALPELMGISHQWDSVAFSIHLRAISQQMPKLLFSTMSLKIILLKMLPHFPGANEWKYIPHRSVLVSIPNYNKAQACVNSVYIHVRHDHRPVVYGPWWYIISNDSRGYCRVLNMAWNSVCYWQKYESVSHVGQCQHICVQVFVLSYCWHRWTCIFLVHHHNISQFFFFCCFYINLLNKIMQWQSDACRTPES